MLNELRDLYQDVILDHGRTPRNFRHPAEANHQAHGMNPLCGDSLLVYVTLDGEERLADVAFEGQGCAISVASASLMTEVLRGKTRVEAETLFHDMHALCTEEHPHPSAGSDADALERLAPLSGVRQFPIRVKCATLAWHTLKAALDGRTDVSSDED